MEIHQTATLEQSVQYSALVNQKNPLLNQVFDLAMTEGIWELTEDERRRPLLKLRLQDQFGGRCTAEFAPDELKSDNHLSFRLDTLKAALVRVRNWRGQLTQLFGNIRVWCQSLPGGAFVKEELVILREELSGEYEATRLLIISNGQTMRVEPIAAWVVGADGRVDLKGTGGPLTLLYMHGTTGGWFYMQDHYPSAMIPLTEALFLQLAEACLHG